MAIRRFDGAGDTSYKQHKFSSATVDLRRWQASGVSARSEPIPTIDGRRANLAASSSGGEQRRLELSRALATKPLIVLLDEPFAGVDPIAVQEIQSLIERLRTRNIGILITDHNVRETLQSTDRAYIIHQGRSRAQIDEHARQRDANRLWYGISISLRHRIEDPFIDLSIE